MYLPYTMNVLMHAYDIIINNFYLGKSVQVMIEFDSCESLIFRGVLITFSDSFHYFLFLAETYMIFFNVFYVVRNEISAGYDKRPP